MANRDAPSGFKVAKHLTGGNANKLGRYHIVAALAANIYRGDVVVPVNTSKRITRPSAGTERPIGVFDGCFFIAADGEPCYRPKWTSGQTVQSGSVPDAFVYDDPNIVFEVQADEDIEAADIGAFADYTIGTGNDFTCVSGDELDSSSFGSGTTLKLLDYVRRPDNALGENFTKCLVAFAIHYHRGAMTAI
jgi:hypothetical protein